MSNKNPPDSGPDGVIKFDYIKSNHFRVIHADGAVGGTTPSGYLQMNLWSQRLAIPRQVVHKVADGRLGDEIARDSRDAVVREVEAGVLLDLRAAVHLRDWLQSQIETLSARLVEDADLESDFEEEPTS